MYLLICFRELSDFGLKLAEMFQYGVTNQEQSSHVECVTLLTRS